MAGSVLAVVEQREGKYRKSAFEVVTAANDVAGQMGTETVALVIGTDSPENVGNLVCPAEFKIGENVKIMILSTPEGSDKPAKYPLMFKESSVMLINKTDLLPYVDFDTEKAKQDTLTINPDIKIFVLSCKTSDGFHDWSRWLTDQIDFSKNHNG